MTRHILETHAPGCTIDFPHDVPVVAGAGVGALWALDKLRAYVAGALLTLNPQYDGSDAVRRVVTVACGDTQRTSMQKGESY